MIAAVGVEAAERPQATTVPPASARGTGVSTARAATTAPVWLDGAWRDVPLYAREELRAGDEFTGPALVSEHGATGWIATGWSAAAETDGALLVRRIGRAAMAVRPESTVPDPLRLEIFNGLFMHVAEQMGVVLRQTASSVNIKERLDYSCALFDGAAGLVANAPHMPVHLGSMGASVAAVLEAHGADLQPGDAFLLNSPYHGGTHLPDMTVVTPVFDPAGRRVHFFTASRAHHADIGGTTPGSMPPGSRDIAEEGVLITPTRIVRAGRFDDQAVRRAARCGALAGAQRRSRTSPTCVRSSPRTRVAFANSSVQRPPTAGQRCSPTWGTCRTTPKRACVAPSADCATVASATRWTTASSSR